MKSLILEYVYISKTGVNISELNALEAQVYQALKDLGVNLTTYQVQYLSRRVSSVHAAVTYYYQNVSVITNAAPPHSASALPQSGGLPEREAVREAVVEEANLAKLNPLQVQKYQTLRDQEVHLTTFQVQFLTK